MDVLVTYTPLPDVDSSIVHMNDPSLWETAKVRKQRFAGKLNLPHPVASTITSSGCVIPKISGTTEGWTLTFPNCTWVPWVSANSKLRYTETKYSFYIP